MHNLLSLNSLLIIAFAILDRFWGAGFQKNSFLDKNHHKISAVLAILTVVLSVFINTWPAALFGVAWFAYRSLPFDIFGGDLTPSTTRQYAGSFLRFLTPLPFFVGYAFLTGKDPIFAGSVFLLASLANTITSAWYGWQVKAARDGGTTLPWDYNIVVELLHGALYGAAAACLMAH